MLPEFANRCDQPAPLHILEIVIKQAHSCDTIKMQNRNGGYQTIDTGRLIWAHTLWKQVAQNDKTEKQFIS